MLGILLRLENGDAVPVPQANPEACRQGMSVLGDLLRKSPADRASAFAASGVEVTGEGIVDVPMVIVDARCIVAAHVVDLFVDEDGDLTWRHPWAPRRTE